VLAKAEEIGLQLAAKREQLKELQRAGRRPNVKHVKGKKRRRRAREASRPAAG
jgi:hypothetical protein